MIKLSSFSPHLAVAAAALLLPASVHAQMFTFEDYDEGAINGPEGSGTATFPGTNQDGWSNSTSTAGGFVYANSVNGLPGSGQFLSLPNTASTVSMIAGRPATFPVGAATTVSFDLRFITTPSGAREGMAGFAQAFPGDTFSNADAGILFGQTGPTSFGYRAAGFGTNYAQFAPTFAGDQQIPTPVPGNWYGITATIAPEVDGNRAVRLELFDYASSTLWADFTFDVPLARFGAVAPEDSAGVVVRLTRGNIDDDFAGAIDNLDFTVIPEPSTYALMIGVAGLAFATLRRRRKA